MRAIKLNNVKVDANKKAFLIGAHEVRKPSLGQEKKTSEYTLDDFKAKLTQYHDAHYAKKYENLMNIWENAAESLEDYKKCQSFLSKVHLIGYRLFAVKDEFEVARLFTSHDFKNLISKKFENVDAVQLNLAPPFLPGLDALTGRPKKRTFGPWFFHVLKMLSALRTWRFSKLNPFAWSTERRLETLWRKRFEEITHKVAPKLNAQNIHIVEEIVDAFHHIRGFGPVKEQRMKEAELMLESALGRL